MAGPFVLFSEAWFERARRLAGGVALPDADVTVEYRAATEGGAITHHQAFAGGRLVAWERGAAAAPDLVLRQRLQPHLALLLRAGLGDRVLRETVVVDTVTGQACPPPPLDEVVLDWGGDLPAIPTAGEVVVQQVLTDSPFGAVAVHFRLDRGRVVEAGAGMAERADVRVVRRYAHALRERSGELDVLDSIEQGSIEGDFRKMALLLGIYDSDECRDARRALTRPWLGALVALGEVLSSPAWRRVAAALSPPRGERRAAG